MEIERTNKITGEVMQEMYRLFSGVKMKGARVERQWSLRGLERWWKRHVPEKFWVTNQTLKNWEDGNYVPDANSVSILGDIFDLPLDAFYEDKKVS